MNAVAEADGSCVFCGIVAGTEPARIVREWYEVIAFVPLNPVVSGHTLVVPRVHVRDAVESSSVTALTMRCDAELARDYGASNILTSCGVAATQSVMHLHIHVIPRRVGDQLMVPWGTTGDPHAPHRCSGVERLEAELETVRGERGSVATASLTHLSAPRAADSVVRYIPVAVEGRMRTW